VNILALDTCDSRGSLAVMQDERVLHAITHEGTADYSSWVLPVATQALSASALKMKDIEVFAVATGPGSFTGLRVGLTTVKAWSEVYGGQIAGIPRLEAIASLALAPAPHVAAFVDAQRGQLFGALFRREASGLHPLGEELVIAPEGFVEFVRERAAGLQGVAWISLDPDKVTSLPSWRECAKAGDTMEKSDAVLAPVIGRLALRRAAEGRLTDALHLDAEYVRRSDAEIFWKGGARHSA
jgi:tRNA threonylcarbamoyladenosine biosynthesis protein TsaB